MTTFYTAALSAALLLQLACPTSARHSQQLAFVPHHHHATAPICSSSLSSTINDIPSDTTTSISSGGDPESILQARNRLVALSTTLAGNSSSGKVFIRRPSDKIKLQKAINDLEALSSASSTMSGDRVKEMMLGDWTLVATASLPSSDIRRRFNKNDNKKKNKSKGGWFNKTKKQNPIQKSISESIEVTQRIRNIDSDEINRVDNVIQFTPLNTLESIIPTDSPLFDLLGKVNVNPLQVKQSKVVLVHKAEVESVQPVLRTKIALTSTVLNIAGSSQFFDPEGADIFGVNNILGEFINVGTFDTPYVDGDVRISRTSGPVLEQLRVFVREGSILEDDAMMDSLMAVMRVEEETELNASSNSDDDVGSKVMKVVEAADNVQKAVTSMATNAKSTIEKDLDGVNKAIGETMDDVVSKVQDAVEDDLEQIGKALNKVQNLGEAITEVAEAVAKVPNDVLSIVEEDVTELGDKVEEALDTLVADVQDSVEEDLKQVGKSIEGVGDAATGSVGEKEDDAELVEIEGVGDAATGSVGEKEDDAELVEKVEEALDAMTADLQDSVDSDLEQVEKSMEDVGDAATGSVVEKEDDAELVEIEGVEDAATGSAGEKEDEAAKEE